MKTPLGLAQHLRQHQIPLDLQSAVALMARHLNVQLDVQLDAAIAVHIDFDIFDARIATGKAFAQIQSLDEPIRALDVVRTALAQLLLDNLLVAGRLFAHKLLHEHLLVNGTLYLQNLFGEEDRLRLVMDDARRLIVHLALAVDKHWWRPDDLRFARLDDNVTRLGVHHDRLQFVHKHVGFLVARRWSLAFDDDLLAGIAA